MARKLSTMTWQDVQKEMSIAGCPEKIIHLGKTIEALIAGTIDGKCIPEIENTHFALERILAELKLWEKLERNRQRIS